MLPEPMISKALAGQRGERLAHVVGLPGTAAADWTDKRNHRHLGIGEHQAQRHPGAVVEAARRRRWLHRQAGSARWPRPLRARLPGSRWPGSGWHTGLQENPKNREWSPAFRQKPTVGTAVSRCALTMTMARGRARAGGLGDQRRAGSARTQARRSARRAGRTGQAGSGSWRQFRRRWANSTPLRCSQIDDNPQITIAGRTGPTGCDATLRAGGRAGQLCRRRAATGRRPLGGDPADRRAGGAPRRQADGAQHAAA